MNAVVCTVRYGRQSAASIIQSISSPDGMLYYRLVTGTIVKVLHELHIAKASLLMATELGSTWVGKGSPFCSALLANRAADAMSSTEEVFCDITWLLAIADDKLWDKRRLPGIELLIF